MSFGGGGGGGDGDTCPQVPTQSHPARAAESVTIAWIKASGGRLRGRRHCVLIDRALCLRTALASTVAAATTVTATATSTRSSSPCIVMITDIITRTSVRVRDRQRRRDQHASIIGRFSWFPWTRKSKSYSRGLLVLIYSVRACV